MLEKHAGNLGSTNSVAWMFSKKGHIVVEKSKADEEKLLSVALEAGADDMQDDGETLGSAVRSGARSRRCATR